MDRIIFLLGMIVFVLAIVLGFILPEHTEVTDCYDDRGSLIKELTCEKIVTESIWVSYVLVFIGFSVLMIGIIVDE